MCTCFCGCNAVGIYVGFDIKLNNAINCVCAANVDSAMCETQNIVNPIDLC